MTHAQRGCDANATHTIQQKKKENVNVNVFPSYFSIMENYQAQDTVFHQRANGNIANTQSKNDEEEQA